MSTKKYKLIFKGEIAEGNNIDDVKKNLAKIFNTDVREIEKLFTNESHIIKQDISYDECKELEKLFNESGAICKIEEQDDETLKLNDVKTISTSSPEVKENKTIDILSSSSLVGKCKHCKSQIPYDVENCPKCASGDPFSKKAMAEQTSKMYKQKWKMYGLVIGTFFSVIICIGWGWFGWLIILTFLLNVGYNIMTYYGERKSELYDLFKHAKSSAVSNEAKVKVDDLINSCRKKLGFDIGLFDLKDENHEEAVGNDKS